MGDSLSCGNEGDSGYVHAVGPILAAAAVLGLRWNNTDGVGSRICLDPSGRVQWTRRKQCVAIGVNKFGLKKLGTKVYYSEKCS
jgi:hypothetical protein